MVGNQNGVEDQQAHASRLNRYLGFLGRDPNNLQLLEDAAIAAFDAGNFDQQQKLLEHYEQLSALSPRLTNLKGLIALRNGDYPDAACIFDDLLKHSPNDASLRFNRAWVHALSGDFESVLSLIDVNVAGTQPHAAKLRVQALHHLSRLDEALLEGADLVRIFPHDAGLLGALSVVAMDADEFDLARVYAEKAGSGVDAMTTCGLIRLQSEHPSEAAEFFDQVLETAPDAPRALIGKGLALAALGQSAHGADYVRRGAEVFGDHLGSWIAVGWMYLLGNDFRAARASFERARAIDENFAESHGGLAVVDIAEGSLDSAQKRADIAMRLDREAFGGMLAQMILRDTRGDAAGAQRIWDKAMKMGVGANGKTLAQTMVGFGFSPTRQPRGKS
jgi:tetratricopeptide (TPR) repeat protein